MLQYGKFTYLQNSLLFDGITLQDVSLNKSCTRALLKLKAPEKSVSQSFTLSDGALPEHKTQICQLDFGCFYACHCLCPSVGSKVGGTRLVKYDVT